MRNILRTFALPVLVAIIVIVITQDEILQLGIVQRLELASLDYRFQQRGVRETISDSSEVIIVEVSDESFRSLPDRWPWPRSYYARLIRNLHEAGARVIAIDIILNGPDPYSPNNDEQLRKAIRESGRVVLAGKLEAEHDTYQVVTDRRSYANQFYPVDSSLGLVNIRNDADGVHRRYNPYWERTLHVSSGKTDTLRIPTFGFAVLNKYYGLDHAYIAQNATTAFNYDWHVIPKYDATSMLINFSGPSGTFRRVKFVDVIDDETLTTLEEAESGMQVNTFSDPQFGYKHDGTFQDKIVLVGSTNPEDHDLFPVSIAHGTQHGDNLMYGVEIHANIIESVLRNEFLTRQSKWLEILTIVAFVFLAFFATSWLRGSRLRRTFAVELYVALLTVVLVVAWGMATVELFTASSYVAAVISPTLALLGGYVASTAYHYVAERKQRLLIKTMFSTYVNPTVVDQLIANPGKLALGGERRVLTVLFSDIEGFTSLSEGIAPENLVSLLNDYLSEMAGIVLKNDGTLDKYEGDAVMAFWGAPIVQEDHALHACVCALEMQDRLTRIRDKWKAEGKPMFHARIGINTGEMVVGNMGGKEKFDFTVIGDSVNLASRLEGANRFYKTGIIIGEDTFKAVSQHLPCRELDLVTVRGRTVPLRIYELCAADQEETDLKQFITLYQEGLRLFRSRQWNAAEQALAEALRLRPADFPTHLQLQRIETLRQSSLPEEWVGVFDLATK